MSFPLISTTDTDIWLDFWNITFKAYLEAALTGTGGGGGWPFPFTQNGRIIDVEDDGLEAQEPPSPTLALILPAGGKWVINGAIRIPDVDIQLSPLPANFTGWVTPTFTHDEEFDMDVWGFTTSATRPAAGSGAAGKVVTGADAVISFDASESVSDVLPTLPIILARLASGFYGGGGGGGVEFWQALKKTSLDPTTIEQFVTAVMADHIEKYHGGAGQGATIVPAEVRDENMVNILHSLSMHQMVNDDIFERVPPHFAIAVSPGRGTGAWSYAAITDEALTTMPVDPVNHVFGQLP